jgi:hypothetical protein
VAIVRLPWGNLTDIYDLWVPASLRRRLSLTLAFLGFGFIAGTSGLALIATDNASDPRSAFAFAPLQSASVGAAASTTPAGMPRVETALVRQTTSQATSQATSSDGVASCAGKSRDDADARCASDAASNAASKTVPADTVSAPAAAGESTLADSPRPAIANSEPAVPVASTPTPEEDASKPTEVALSVAEAPAPIPAAAKPQKTARQQSGRRHASQQSSAWLEPHSRRGRAQHFWPFW